MPQDIDFFLDQPYRREVQRTAFGWIARIVEIPQVLTRPQPDSASAMSDLDAVFAAWLDDAVRLHRAVPPPLDAGDYSGSFRFRCPPELHRALATEARLSGVSLNALLVDAASRRLGSIAGRTAPGGFRDYVQAGLMSPAHADRLHRALHDGARMLLIGPRDSGRTTLGRALLREMAGFGGSMYTLGVIDPYDEWFVASGIDRCTSCHDDVQAAFLGHYVAADASPVRRADVSAIDRLREKLAVGQDPASFSDAIRVFLEADRDAVLLGETPDPDTMEDALRAAETGHLVFSRVGPTPVVYLSSTLVHERVSLRIIEDWAGGCPSAGLMLVDSRDLQCEQITDRERLEAWLGRRGFELEDVADVLIRTGWNRRYGIRSDFLGDSPASFW